MKRTNKKGFTIVELVIVIAVIAILAAVLIPTFSNVIKKANVSKDTQLVRNLNTSLSVDKAINGEHDTMQDALNAAEASGYNVAKINASATDNEILWDSVADCFCYFNKETNTVEYTPDVTGTKATNDVDLWKIDSTPSDVYSTYLYDATATTFDAVKTGLDVGEETVTSIKFIGEGKTVTIRTNSVNTALVIDAKDSTVNHYDVVNTVEVIRTSYACYHEYGTAAYVECASGKVVAETNGEIKTVILTAVKTSGDLAATVLTSGGEINNVFATTNDVATANNSANTTHDTLTVKVLSEGGDVLEVATGNENALNDAIVEKKIAAIIESKKAVQETCIHNLVDNKCTICGFDGYKWSEVIEGSSNLTELSTNNYVINSANDLAVLAKMVNAGNNFSGKTVTLNVNIDLKQYLWTPIGCSGNNFCGIFDGNNKTITGLYVNQSGESAGLFGIVSAGTIKNLTIDGAKVVNNANYAAVLCGQGYTGTIENITIKNSSAISSGQYVGAISGSGYATITGCSVDNCEFTGSEQVGGIVGYIRETSGNVNGNTVKNSTINATSRCGGIVGKAQFSGNHTLNTNIVENCTITAKDGTAAGLAAQVMGSTDSFEIKGNTIKNVTISGKLTNDVFTDRGDNATFTAALAKEANVANNTVTK